MDSEDLAMRQMITNQTVRNIIDDRSDDISYYGGNLSQNQFDSQMLDIIDNKKIKRLYPSDHERFFKLKTKIYPMYLKINNLTRTQSIFEDFIEKYDVFVKN
jgi:hypothetical protein